MPLTDDASQRGAVDVRRLSWHSHNGFATFRWPKAGRYGLARDRWDVMQTPYDWLTIALFAGLIVIFLQRSMGQEEEKDSLLSYFPPAIGCAVVNYLGNEGYDVIAIAGIVAIVIYTQLVIKPFKGLKW